MASPTPPANPNSPSSSTKSNVAPPAPTKLPPPPPPLPPHNPDTPLAPPSATATKSPPPPPLLPPPSATATKSPPPPPPPPPLPNQPPSSTPTITSASSSSFPVNLTGSDPTPHMKAGEVGDVPLPRTTDPKGTTGPIPDPIPDASADLQNVNRGSEIGHQQEQRTDDWTVEIEEGEKERVEIEEVEEEETVQQSTADASTRVPTREAVSNPQLRQRHRNPRDGRDLEGQEDTDLEKPLINGSPRVKSFCDYLVQFCGWRKTSDGTSGDDDPPPPPPPPPGDSSSSNDLDPTEDVEDKTYGFMGMLLFFSITMIPILEHQSSKKPLSPQPSQKSWDWEQGLYDLFYTASQCICVISLIFVFAIAIKLFKEGGQAKRSMNRRLMHTLRFLFVLLCVAALLRCSSPFFHLYFIVALIGILIIQLIKVFRSGWDWNQLFLL